MRFTSRTALFITQSLICDGKGWRHHIGFTLDSVHSNQVWWRSDDKRSSYNHYKPRFLPEISELWPLWWRHWPHSIIYIKFGEDWMRYGQVITLTCYEWANFISNQWAVAPVIMSLWGHSRQLWAVAPVLWSRHYEVIQDSLSLTYVKTILPSLVKLGWKLIMLSS